MLLGFANAVGSWWLWVDTERTIVERECCVNWMQGDTNWSHRGVVGVKGAVELRVEIECTKLCCYNVLGRGIVDFVN